MKMKNVKTRINKNGRPDETAEVMALRALRTDYYTILQQAIDEERVPEVRRVHAILITKSCLFHHFFFLFSINSKC